MESAAPLPWDEPPVGGQNPPYALAGSFARAPEPLTASDIVLIVETLGGGRCSGTVRKFQYIRYELNAVRFMIKS